MSPKVLIILLTGLLFPPYKINVLGQLQENKGKHFEYTIELLYETKPLLRPVLPEIRRIHRYYECVLNCTPMTVSQEMCEAAHRVLVFLKEKV